MKNIAKFRWFDVAKYKKCRLQENLFMSDKRQYIVLVLLDWIFIRGSCRLFSFTTASYTVWPRIYIHFGTLMWLYNNRFYQYTLGLLCRHWGKQPWIIWTNTCHALLEVTYRHGLHLNCCWTSHAISFFSEILWQAFIWTENDHLHSCLCVNNLHWCIRSTFVLVF